MYMCIVHVHLLYIKCLYFDLTCVTVHVIASQLCSHLVCHVFNPQTRIHAFTLAHTHCFDMYMCDIWLFAAKGDFNHVHILHLCSQIKGSSGLLNRITFAGEDSEFLIKRQHALEVEFMRMPFYTRN